MSASVPQPIRILIVDDHAIMREGLKNREIARRLFISEATVGNHLRAIFGKLEVASRLELLIYAYRHGLARPPR